MNKNYWLECDETSCKTIEEFAQEYKLFLSECKTERQCIKFFVKILKENGFKDLGELIASGKKLKKGDKVFAVNMNKAIVIFVIGSAPMSEGLDILAAHIDSPRLDLKSNPIYEDSGFCLFDTHYYGGIKKYQWVTTPLAMHGLVCKKDGTKIDIKIGENENDPVFGVTDLLPHLEKSASEKKKEPVNGEQLNLIVGAKSDKNSIKGNIISLLKTMGFEESDLLSAEIEVVPAGKARDFGLDRSMIMGYGHDDRCCAFAALKALLAAKDLKKTGVTLLVDKEETGSDGPTGMKSKFFENVVAEVMNLCGEYRELDFKRALNKSQVISCDVTAGFDPNYPEPSNKATEAYLSRGVAFNKYNGSDGKSGSSDANPEYIAKLRKVLDENKIIYQFTEMGKVDQGGGSTIAVFLAEYGMEVIDAGLPILSMHAPWEVISKLDLFQAYKFYKAFLENM